MSELIPIVDEYDNVVEYKERDLLQKNDIYRISALWVSDSNSRFLLAQRSFNKKYDPGKWGPAVSGTVEQNESYFENIIKETKEEIGIDLNKYNFKKVDKIFTDSDWRFFCQWYFLKADIFLEKLVFLKDEVEQLQWVNKNTFEKDLNKNPQKYTISMLQHYTILKNNIN